MSPSASPSRWGAGEACASRLRRAGKTAIVFALNGDELLDADLAELVARHRETDAAATIVVTHPHSPFGVVEVGEDDVVMGFQEAAVLPVWVSCGVYALGEEALAALPERGDHETTTFPDLAARGRLRAFRHDGIWLTINTPKDLRVAERAHEGSAALA